MRAQSVRERGRERARPIVPAAIYDSSLSLLSLSYKASVAWVAADFFRTTQWVAAVSPFYIIKKIK